LIQKTNLCDDPEGRGGSFVDRRVERATGGIKREGKKRALEGKKSRRNGGKKGNKEGKVPRKQT